MTRPGIDAYFLALARVAATRSTCLRRAVGCALVGPGDQLLATGYNGVPRGFPHCNEIRNHSFPTARARDDVLDSLRANNVLAERYTPGNPEDDFDPSIREYPYACPGARAASGIDLAACRAVHAEQNALLQCPDVEAVVTCYVTATPCETCLKLLLNTHCRRIVAAERYAVGSEHDRLLQEWWVGAGRELVIAP